MESSAFVIRPLTAACAAEVTGVQTSQPLDEQTQRRLREALDRYGVLVFRGQELSGEDEVRFARTFGEVSYQGDYAAKAGGFTFVSNVALQGAAGTGELAFHMDHTFYKDPLHGAMLYAIEVPSEGGDTLFASNKRAYEGLPPQLKERIEPLEALHVMDYAITAPLDRFRESMIGPDAPRAVHRIALPHPQTGEKVLYISRRHTDRILGLEPDESEALLAELCSYIGRPEFVYRHRWTAGDLVVWDNFGVQHARTDFDPAQRRHMRRVQIV